MKVICPIRPRTFEEFESLVLKVNDRVDIVEVWIDRVTDVFFEKFKDFEKNNIQFLAVCKQSQEEGEFGGTALERIERLNNFLEAGGDFVDVDITQNRSKEIGEINPKKLILSFHDFRGVSGLDEIFKQMKVYNPSLYKFAVTVNEEVELQQFMAFIEQFPRDKKAIFTTMGKLGTEGRIQIGIKSWGQFFALDAESKTASGQMTLDDLV